MKNRLRNTTYYVDERTLDEYLPRKPQNPGDHFEMLPRRHRMPGPTSGESSPMFSNVLEASAVSHPSLAASCTSRQIDPI